MYISNTKFAVKIVWGNGDFVKWNGEFSMRNGDEDNGEWGWYMV